MARQAEYRYVLYDENGIYLDALYGKSVQIIIDYLRKRGWTSANAGGASHWFKGELKPGQRVGRVYGRDRTKKKHEDQFRHITYIRELWTNDMEYADFRRPDFVTTWNTTLCAKEVNT